MPAPPRMLPDLRALPPGCEIETETPDATFETDTADGGARSSPTSARLAPVPISDFGQLLRKIEFLSPEGQEGMWGALQVIESQFDVATLLLINTDLAPFRRPMVVRVGSSSLRDPATLASCSPAMSTTRHVCTNKLYVLSSGAAVAPAWRCWRLHAAQSRALLCKHFTSLSARPSSGIVQRTLQPRECVARRRWRALSTFRPPTLRARVTF